MTSILPHLCHPPSSYLLVLLTCFLLSDDHLVNKMPAVMAFSAQILCSRIPGLTPKQRNICQSRPEEIVAVGDGAKLALSECQHQFHKHRWNCSNVAADHLFVQKLKVGSREAAYTTAVHAAGVTYRITAECSRGSLTTCGCGGEDNELPVGRSWKWTGCSDHIRYGMRFSSTFLDEKEKQRKYHKERTLMNLHNNRAGRKAVKATMRMNCRCSGVSGSCALKTCWKTLSAFSKVGTYLKYKYHHAKQVEALHGYRRRSRRKTPLYLKLSKALIPLQKPRRKDLVFLDNSPNYCEMNKSKGSFGTSGRVCNKSSDGPDNCDLLCCGRGYNTHQYTRSQQCHCKFHWCCHVTCQVCHRSITQHSCK